MKSSAPQLVCFLLMVLILLAPAAQALTVTAGWVHADIGLEEDGDGFFTEIQETWPLGSSGFDVTVAGEYLQRAGTMHRYYSDPHTGQIHGEANVTLHGLQPAVFLGWRLPVSSFTSRIYTGTSVILSVSESWDEPEGETNGDYGYENLDFQIHAGFLNEISSFVLDVRFSYGLIDQLVDRTEELLYPNKAEVIDYPEDGAKITSVQIGVGYSF